MRAASAATSSLRAWSTRIAMPRAAGGGDELRGLLDGLGPAHGRAAGAGGAAGAVDGRARARRARRRCRDPAPRVAPATSATRPTSVVVSMASIVNERSFITKLTNLRSRAHRTGPRPAAAGLALSPARPARRRCRHERSDRNRWRAGWPWWPARRAVRAAASPSSSAPPARPSTAPGRARASRRSEYDRPETIDETAELVARGRRSRHRRADRPPGAGAGRGAGPPDRRRAGPPRRPRQRRVGRRGPVRLERPRSGSTTWQRACGCCASRSTRT